MDPEQFDTKADFTAHCAKMLMEKYPKSSNLRFVADKVGVSASTFEQVLRKEGHSPRFGNVIKIVKSVCSDGDVKKFIEKFYPEMLDEYLAVYPNNSEIPFANSEAEDFFTMNSTYEIMLFALNTPDLTREEIGREFGRKGLNILERLVQRNVIQTDGEKYSIQGPLKLEQPASHAILKNLLENNYDIENFGHKDNWLSVQTQSVNLKKIMPELKKILSNANQDIRKILNDPRYKGREIVWAGLIMDDLCQQKDNPQNKHGNPIQ